MKNLYYGGLLFFARLTCCLLFWPFHQVVRFAYRRILIPIMNWRLRGQFPISIQVRLEPRHSVKDGRGFNAFLSDIDLSAYLEAPTDENARVIREFVQSWRKYLPFIGELEIYSFDEKRKLQVLPQKYKVKSPLMQHQSPSEQRRRLSLLSHMMLMRWLRSLNDGEILSLSDYRTFLV